MVPVVPVSRLRIWLMAARLPTLPAAVAPVLVGSATAAAASHFRFAVFLAALVSAVLIQIGTNLANDYFDFHKGADTADRLGPVRVTQSGLLSPATVRAAMIVTFGLSILAGLYLVVIGGWPILLIGLLSIACGILYTGGPWPLGYHGLGDIFVFIFFGLIGVVGTAYLHSDMFMGSAVINAIPVGLLVTAIIVVNNLRDIDTDRLAGKHTLAVRMGRSATRIEYALLVVIAYVVPLGRWFAGATFPWCLLPWVSIPMALAQVRIVFSAEGRALNPALKGTGQFLLLYSLLFSASILA